MTEKYEQRVKIFQQAMQTCHSNNPTDCIEWFADRIVDLQKENAELKELHESDKKSLALIAKKGAELEKDYEVLSCSVGDFGELQDRLEEEQRKNNGLSDNLANAKEIMQKLIANAPNTYSGTNIELQQKKMFSFQDAVNKAEQFLNEDKAETSEEPYYVIMNMNCQYEICRKCPKSGLFKGTYKECENWIKEKLSEVEK